MPEEAALHRADHSRAAQGRSLDSIRLRTRGVGGASHPKVHDSLRPNRHGEPSRKSDVVRRGEEWVAVPVLRVDGRAGG